MLSIVKRNWSITFPNYKSTILISKNTNLMQNRKTVLLFLFNNYDLSWGCPVLPCSRGWHDDTSSKAWNCHFRPSSYITDAPESWATDFTGLRIKPLCLSTVATYHRSNTTEGFWQQGTQKFMVKSCSLGLLKLPLLILPLKSCIMVANL